MDQFAEESNRFDKHNHKVQPIDQKNQCPSSISFSSEMNSNRVNEEQTPYVRTLKRREQQIVDVLIQMSQMQAVILQQQTLNPPKKYQLLQIMKTDNFIKRFKTNLMMNSYVLSQSDRTRIDEKFKKKTRQTKINNKISNSRIPVFKSSSIFLLIWDFIGIIANLIILWLAPFILSFKNQIEESLDLNVLITTITIYILIDILMNCNRGIIHQGEELKKRFQIIKEYLRNRAIYDFISAVLWIIATQKSSITSSGISETLIFVQMVVTYVKVQYYFLNNFEPLYLKGNLYSNVLDLISLIIQIYFYAHFTACIFHFAGHETEYLGNTWLIKYEIQNESIWIKYNYAFYWATMTMTTVGYGDVAAQNYIEILCSSIIMFFSSCVFAYSMNSIGMILKGFYDTKLKYKRILTQINGFMKQNQVDLSIQGRVRNYLSYSIESEGNNNDDINNIIELMPPSLQNELLKDVHMKIINQMPILKNLFSKSTLQELQDILKLTKYTPGDLIYSIGDQSNQNLYFVHEGEVEHIEENSQFTLQITKKGQVCGIYSFFSGFPPKMTARSKGFTQLYKLDRSKFLQIILNNSKDLETFHHIKDKMIFSSNYQLIDRKCQICNKNNHIEMDCPLIQYKPDMEQRFKKDEFLNQKNKRSKFNRKKLPRIKAISMIEQYTLLVDEFLQKQPDNIQDSTFFYTKNLHIAGSVPTSKSEDDQSSSAVNSPNQIKHKDTILQENKRQSVMIKTQDTVIKLNSNIQLFEVKKEMKMLDELETIKNSFCIDKVYQYKNYMPQNNIDYIIEQINQFQRAGIQKLQKILNNLNAYMYTYVGKLKAFKMRQQADRNYIYEND